MSIPHDLHGMEPQNPGPHGPTGTSGPYRPDGTTGCGKRRPDGPGSAGSPDSLDEPALRRLMRDAVQGIEPSDDALDQLRTAVPARKVRRRQALAGAGAVVLLACAAVPAVVRVANTADDAASRQVAGASGPHIADHGSGTYDGGDDGGRQPSSVPGPGTGSPGGGDASGPPGADMPAGTPPTVAITSAGTTDARPPACSRAQLGAGSGGEGAPDAVGKVYGWFRVANVSARGCTVDGGGVVTARVQGGTGSPQIAVVDHTAGDPAAGLPDVTAAPLVLEPGQAYEVRFAWVPDSGGTGGCSTSSSPTPEPTSTATGAPVDGAGAGGTGDAAQQDGQAAPASSSDSSPPSAEPPGIALSHTPEVGTPAVAGTTIPGACAGTVYTTPAMDAS